MPKRSGRDQVEAGSRLVSDPAVETRLAAESLGLDFGHEELVAAQLQLATAAERFESLFEALPIPLLLVDRQVRPLKLNSQAREWSGLDRTQGALPWRAILNCFSRADQAQLVKLVDATSKGKPGVCRGLRWLQADQLGFDIDVHALGVMNQSGHVDVVLAIMLRGYERNVEARQVLLEGLVNSTSDLIYAFDPNGKALFANQATCEFLGLPAGSVEGQLREEVMPFDAALAHRSADESVLADGLSVEIQEERYGLGSVVPRYLSTRKFLIADSKGNSVGVGGVSRDVTGEVRRSRELMVSELVFQNGTDSIIVFDRDGIVLRVNPAFERLTGFSSRTVVGRPVGILHDPGQSKASLGRIERAVATNGTWSGEIGIRDAKGGRISIMASINTLVGLDGATTGFVAVGMDLTAIRRVETQIARLAFYDPLTGLPNRTMLMDRLEKTLQACVNTAQSFGVLFIDLDHFKEVNDSLGHSAGDILLQRISARLSHALRAEDTVARIGGDEFVVVLPFTDLDSTAEVAKKLFAELRRPIDLPRAPGYIPSLSIGVTAGPAETQTVEQILQHADTAMYAAKEAGRGRIALYKKEMSQKAHKQFMLNNEFPSAVQQGRLRLFVQPKVALGSRELVGAEGLVRWDVGNGGPVMAPGDFLWALEREPLLRMLDEWVVNEGVSIACRWKKRGLLPDGFRFSVNHTATDIGKPVWLSRISKIIEKQNAPAGLLEIELTEDMLIRPSDDALLNLHSLQSKGVALSIDDFGTGYSSLSYLQRLPVSTIKIDKSFVQNIVDNRDSQVLVRTIVSLAHNLNHSVVAEGVETEDQRLALIDAGCEFGQGYLFSKPLPLEEFEALYLRPKPLSLQFGTSSQAS